MTRISTRALELKAELEKRANLKSLGRWCETCLKVLDQKPQPHHWLLIEDLERLERGEFDKLAVNMPPGAAKSTYGSVFYPPWVMARNPNFMVIGASHTSDLAEKVSSRVIKVGQEFAPDGLGMKWLTEGVKGWETDNGGEYKPIGVGGAVTGRRSDLGIIDDPVKSAAEAKSLVVREATWEWYLNDFVTRLKPGGRQLLIMTRWHHDDLAGRVLEASPGDWKVLCIRAESEGPEDDPLGREKGVMLWSDDAKFAFGAMLEKRKREFKRAGAVGTWESLYQQRPTPAEGDIFQPGPIQIVDAVPAGTKWKRGWDFAATDQTGKTDPDYTVGLKMGRYMVGDTPAFIIGGVKRFRGGPEVVERELKQTAQLDGRLVEQNIPQDPGAAGKTVVFNFVRLLAGFTVKSSPESGDKTERAGPFAAQVNVGNVVMLRGDWNEEVLNEMKAFPNGKHDDIIDAGSRAFNALQEAPPGAKRRRVNLMGR